MLLPVETLMTMEEFAHLTEEELTTMVEAVENLIRAGTNNSFQLREARFSARSLGKVLYGTSPLIQPGDRVQITGSANAGLYTVLRVEDGCTEVAEELYSLPHNLVTRVVYPPAVCQGALNLLKWEVAYREKTGVKSESLSRHSVTYFDQDAGNTALGYPVSLLGFLKPYRRARF